MDGDADICTDNQDDDVHAVNENEDVYTDNEDDDLDTNNEDEDEEEFEDVWAEDEQDYRPGGLHPVHLDDRLGPEGRYRVVHKLGFGGHGTVWLCHDRIESRWRAVKILSADLGGPEKCKELETANKLLSRLDLEAASGLQSLLDRHHIALPVDHFNIDGPHGTHLALVYPLLGSSAGYAFELCGPHTELLKDICFQLVNAMDFLHRNGRCHGDFRSANILLRLVDGVDQWPEEELLKVLGKPKTGPLLLRDPVAPGTTLPGYLVTPTRFDYTSGLLLTSVAVSDFGVSFDAKDPPHQTSIPLPRRAPEDMIAGIASPGFASDVWTLMHTIMEMRLGKTVMALDERASFDEADEFADGAAIEIWESTTFMGPMPKNYRTVWKEKGGFFENGHEDDDSVPVVAMAGTLEDDRAEWAEKTGVFPGDYLRSRLMDEHYTRLDAALWDAIVRQDYKATGLMPRLPHHSKHWNMQDHVCCKLDPVELEQLYDLCKSVHKWQPNERALTGEILNHPWFGDRNKRANIEEINTNNEVDIHELATTSTDEGSQTDRASISSAEETQQEDDFTVSTIDEVNDGKATVSSVDEVAEDTPMLGNVDLEKGYGAVSSKEGVKKDQEGISVERGHRPDAPLRGSPHRFLLGAVL
ncbi:kinase-like domain-containing protein [Rhypophila decipiens]|uniref:non-specific serine/threonine protein kinase n=1 Tax=Rhypophila decipiens TaxID=261697 RepID=A0AAN6XU21_9PEZI|nr:kinase-like domain-containing protein [Rhypophila decipiens]